MRAPPEWISDRPLCFLASGKPTVVQDTGAGLPWAFSDLRGAAAAIEQVLVSYGEQCAAARALAEERFDACRVAGSVLELAL